MWFRRSLENLLTIPSVIYAQNKAALCTQWNLCTGMRIYYFSCNEKKSSISKKIFLYRSIQTLHPLDISYKLLDYVRHCKFINNPVEDISWGSLDRPRCWPYTTAYVYNMTRSSSKSSRIRKTQIRFTLQPFRSRASLKFVGVNMLRHFVDYCRSLAW